MVSDKKRLTNTGSTQKPCYQLQAAATTQCGKQSCCMPPHCCCLCFLFPTVGQLGKLEFCGICKPVIFCNETPQQAKYTSIRCCTFPHCQRRNWATRYQRDHKGNRTLHKDFIMFLFFLLLLLCLLLPPAAVVHD